jgi:hypothetical protein
MIGLLVIAALAAPTASARVDVESVTLGDTFQLAVEVVHDPSMTVTVPASLALGDAFSEHGRDTSTRDNGDGTVTMTVVLTIGAYDVGDQTVPAIPVSYVVDGTARTVETRPIGMIVDSYIDSQSPSGAPESEPELRPIAGPVDVMRPDWTVIWVLVGIAGAVALIAIGWAARWAMRRRKVAAAAEQVPLRPAHEEAMARLAELEKSGALEAADLEPAYTSLSEIVRAYLGRRYGFPALDLTTEEINAELAARAEAAEVAGELRAWFDACDLVKFAEYPSSPDEARTALYDARKIVKKSTPAPAATARDREPAAAEPPVSEARSA